MLPWPLIRATRPTHLTPSFTPYKVLYTHTHCRLVEIAKYRHPNSSSSEHLLALASRVHVFTEMTCDILLERLAQLEEIIVDKKIRLVIVDSIKATGEEGI